MQIDVTQTRPSPPSCLERRKASPLTIKEPHTTQFRLFSFFFLSLFPSFTQMAGIIVNGHDTTSYKYHVDGTKAQKMAINRVAEEFEVSKERLEMIIQQFVAEMKKGLNQEGATGK